MILSYFKAAFRSLSKNRLYSIINIVGLSIGIAAVVLILLYLQYEASFDQFHKNGQDIYRISVLWQWEGRDESNQLGFLAPVGPAIKEEFPDVKQFLRLRGPFTDYFYDNNKPIKIDRILHADSSFFEMLSFPLLSGDARRALTEPYSMVLTAATAKRLFGTEDAIGKTLQTGNGDNYNVTAIAQDVPAYSSITFDMLISFSTLYLDTHMYMGWKGGNQYVTYLQLFPNTNPDALQSKFPAFIQKYLGDQTAVKYTLFLQPFQKVHLFYDPGQLYKQIILFGAIALLILTVAGINFVNLSLAQSIKRTKEIGVRKVVGAEKKSLVLQFLTESLLSSTIATILSVLLVQIIFPLYSKIIGHIIPGFSFARLSHDIGLVLIALSVGLVAGSVPALYMSSLAPVKIFKDSLFTGHRKNRVRNVLVVFQFSVSVLLIICTIVIFKQQTFMKNTAVGFKKDNILVLDLQTDDLRRKTDILKYSLLELTEIKRATLCSDIPHRGLSANGYLPEGFDNWRIMKIAYGDEDFVPTFDIQLVKGRNFDPNRPTDRDAYLINETAAHLFGWDDPLNKTIQRGGIHPVIGVVKDFHYAPLRQQIEPMIIAAQPEYGGFTHAALHISGDNVVQTIKKIERTVSDIAPSAPFEYWFLDDSFNALYRFEERLNILFICFSVLAIFIALLGLYSLVTISTEYKTKQIGICKVLGSSVFGITQTISREFLTPVVLSNLIAWPLAYYAAVKWLQTFAYRTNLSWWIFIIASALAILIALATIIFQVIKAASANPIDALRYE